LGNAKSIFESDNVRILNPLTEEPELSFLKRDIKKLIATLSTIEASKKNIVDQEKKINEYQKIVEQCNGRNIDEAVKIELAELKAKIDIIDITNIWDSFENKLKETYSKYNQSYNENQKYRHKVYLLLYMCVLYYGKPNSIEKFINIDEAQDIAISEYRLLREVLGEDAVFNMYGDVNQLVYTYKGITDWDELNDIVTLKLYFLNENYRNTVQITNYCNKVFDAEIVAIGINGDEVKKLMLKNAIADIQKHHSLNPESRIAIIYKKGHEDLAKKATDLLLSQEYIIDSVDNSKISVITVEMAKGLEFERVVVLTEDMSINEKYISYTRALESLIVT
jgi:DNA helicase IV